MFRRTAHPSQSRESVIDTLVSSFTTVRAGHNYPNESNLPIKSSQFRDYMRQVTDFATDYMGNMRAQYNVTNGQVLSNTSLLID